MTRPRQTIRQRDFSGGELDEDAKRRDDLEIVRAGARQMTNWRQRNTGAIENRPGRNVLFLASGRGRTDEVRMSPTATYFLCFRDGVLEIRNSAFAVVATNGGYEWALETIDQIVWTRAGNDIIITFPGQSIRVARWNGASTWTFAVFAFRTAAGGTLEPFARIAKRGMTLTPSAKTGAITLTTDQDYWVPAMVGNVVRWLERQIQITGYVNSTVVNANVLQTLPQSASYTGGLSGSFAPGEIVTNQFGAKAEVTQLLGGTDLYLNHFTAAGYNVGDTITGPSGQMSPPLTGTNRPPQASVIWDEQAINGYRGYPRSCFFDQFRLGFCDIPGVPSGIAWSRIGTYDDFLPGSTADAPIFEFAPDQARVYHVHGGLDEFVFTDRGVRFIPISESNPLKPGSVAFRKLTPDAASQVRPVETAEGVIWVNAGRTRVVAIVGTGQVAQPWVTRDLTEVQGHLIRTPKALAVSTGDGAAPERYLFVLNSDGTVAAGRYEAGKNYVGWVLWSGVGVVEWLSVLGANVLMTTAYAESRTAELVTYGAYLDGSVLVNSPGADISMHNGQMADLMDGLRYLGQRMVSAGAIVPQPGDNLSSPTLTVGRKWTATLELFVPHAQPGQSNGQAQTRRDIKGAVAFQQSTGFVVAGHRVATYAAGDNQEIAPPLREGSETWVLQGGDHDPRPVLTKDTPGPLRILEFTIDASV